MTTVDHHEKCLSLKINYVFMKDSIISAHDEQTIINNATCTVARFSRYYTARLALGRFFSEQDIEDITQDAICRACCFYSSFDPEKGKLSTWVTTIATNCVIDAVDYRIKRLKISFPLILKNDVDGDEFERDEVCDPRKGFNTDMADIYCDWEADTIYERAEIAEAVGKAICSLPERSRKIERMSLAGYEPREIAEMEDCTSNAISICLYKNHSKMKDSLSDFADEYGLRNGGRVRKG